MKNQFLFFLVNAFILISCGSSIELSTKDSPKSVELPDGSFALLNQNSSIEYDQDFNERTVIHKGEVFYSVMDGKGKFNVITKNGDIEVLGTEFNVKSTSDDLEVEVEKGAVQVKSGEFAQEIKKGERAVVKGINDGIEVLEAEFKYKEWSQSLEKDLENLGKDVEKGTKNIGKDLKKGLDKIGN